MALRSLVIRFLTCVLLAATAFTATAEAQPDVDARRAFRRGRAHYENGDFAEAAQQFEEAYRLSRRTQLLYNAYLAHRDGQDLPNAARTLRLFLELSPDTPERDQLGARLAVIERVLAAQRAPAPPGPDAQPDPEQHAQPPPNDDTQEPHPESATPPVLPPEAGPGPGLMSMDDSRDDDQGGGFSPAPVGLVVGGVGAAIMIGGVVTGLIANSAAADLASGCTVKGLCPGSLEDTRDRGQTMALLTDILLIGGGAVLATGAILTFVLAEDSSDDVLVQASCSGTGCFATVSGHY